MSRAAHADVPAAPQLSEVQRERLDDQRTAALAAHQRIAQQARRLTQGQTGPHGNLVKAYDASMAPRCQGQRNCPAPFGRTPGILAEPAAGFIFGLPRPVGNPREASDVQPLIATVHQAMARLSP